MFMLLAFLTSVVTYAFVRSLIPRREVYCIYNRLARNSNEIKFEGYEFPPFVFRDEWNKVLNVVRDNENTYTNIKPGQYITLRININNMNKYRSILHGCSIPFESIMKTVTVDTMKRYNAEWGYVHDGNMVFVVPHIYNIFKGQRDRYLTHMISYITGQLNSKLSGVKNYNLPIITGKISVSDCLMDAMKPLLWSLHISGVNGITIKSSGIDRSYIEKSCEDKMKFLKEKDLLPLSDFEAYGLLAQRIKEPIFCGLKDNENGYYLRTRYKIHKGNPLNYLPGYIMDKSC